MGIDCNIGCFGDYYTFRSFYHCTAPYSLVDYVAEAGIIFN